MNKNNKEKVPTVWFTSDLHCGHNNIIKYCNRPFQDSNHMDEVLITNWNSVVQPQDTIWVLGDFTMGTDAKKYLDRLLGKKILISGNHDRDYSLEQGWAEIYDYKEITIGGQHIVLCHFAFKVWNRSHRGSINLYGHSHNTLPGNSQQLDVGVDAWDYFPVSFDDVKKRLATLPPYRQEDGHNNL